MTEVFSYFKNGTIIDSAHDHITYGHEFMCGRGRAEVYPVLPGIEVTMLNFNASRYTPAVYENRTIIEINHCLQGHMECRLKDGSIQYCSDGDIMLSSLRSQDEDFELPGGSYRGLAVIIDIHAAAAAISELFSGIHLSLDKLAGKFFREKESCVIQLKEEHQHIFTSMYSIAKEARSDYFRVKVQELLIFLYYFEPSAENRKKIYSRQQVDLAKAVQQKLTSSLDRRYTIEELAKEYCISPTALKEYFKGVYGKSIAAYMKEYRIRQACSLLRDNEADIGEIAGRTGYASQSNFTSVFKEITGETPLEYRRRNAADGWSRHMVSLADASSATSSE